MRMSHSPENEQRWPHDSATFYYRPWSYKHRAIREAIFWHRRTASLLSYTSAPTSWVEKNLWQAKKVPKQVAKVHCCLAFVWRSCRSWDHLEDILSSRVMFLFSSCVHRRNRPSVILRTYHEHNKKLPDSVRKSTRLRESTWRPPLIHSVFCAAWMQPGQNRTRTQFPLLSSSSGDICQPAFSPTCTCLGGHVQCDFWDLGN